MLNVDLYQIRPLESNALTSSWPEHECSSSQANHLV